METKKGKKSNPKKGKSLAKLITKSKSDSDTDDSEHELSYYLNDRVKLMKEVLKIIRPKKIKSMAPKWMRNLDMEEINSMLFEELLGISNKRLKRIFDGKKLEDDNSSSTDPDEEQAKPVDIISLDDISDDELVINLDSDDDLTSKHKKADKVKVKEECKRKKIKREKREKITKKSKTSNKEKKDDEQNLMSVLELLELQARARAIKSQLALESKKKAELKEKSEAREEQSDNEDAVVIESPRNIEIIITSSESENEQPSTSNSKSRVKQVIGNSKGNDESETNNEKRTGEQEIRIEGNNSYKRKENSSDPQTSNASKDKSLGEETSKDENINKIGECSKGMNEDLWSKASSSKLTIISDNVLQVGKTQNEIDDMKNKRFRKTQESDSNSKQEESNSDNSETKKVGSEFFSSKEKDSEPGTSKAQAGKKKNRIYRKKLSEDDSNSENDKSDFISCKSDNGKIKDSTADTNTKKTDNGDPGTSEYNKKQFEDQLKGERSNIDLPSISNRIEENDGIVINVDQSEIECIISD